VMRQEFRVVFWGVLLGLAPLSVLGAVLHETTHHRPLGAVTFTVLGALLLGSCVRIVARVAQSSARAWQACRVAAVGSVLWCLVALISG
jgi:F0F1-type ATP synthase assembly protein I